MESLLNKKAFIEEYYRFLRGKMTVANEGGFDIETVDMDGALKDHQKTAVNWALRMGRALTAMSFGLGKTRIQIEIAKQVVEREGGQFLIVCPLGVKHQFVNEDGPIMGTTWKYVRNDQEALEAGTPYLITNYERVRDGNLTAEFIKTLAGVSLDEGSVLRSMSSETSNVFKKVFKPLKYRFVATATPSPNEFKELIYYAEFLGVMDHGQALTRWFKRDTQHAGHLTLMQSQEENFWMWVASWALFLSKPSDLGYSDEGYSLPALNVNWIRIPVDHTRAFDQVDNFGQRRLILDSQNGVSEACFERRATMEPRIEKMLEIMAANPDRHWLLWHDLEDERRAIEKAVPGSLSVYGSQDLDAREQRILDFSHGNIPILATKPRIAGSGCNFQHHCHSAIYTGVGYKFQDFIQSAHRLWRFMQDKPVDIWIIYAESEDGVVEVLKRKWAQHNQMVEKMTDIILKYGLSVNAIRNGLTRSMGVNRVEIKEDLFTAVNNDNVLELIDMPANSVDMILTSIPFSTHYEYVASYNDFGHNGSDEAFFKQMDFLLPQLMRVLIPGRIAAIHVKDLVQYGHKNESGFLELNMFTYQTWAAFKKHGFLNVGEIIITTDVVRENNTTYRLGWSETCKDASKMGVGVPEKILLFRKPPSSSNTARSDKPVVHSKEKYTRARHQIDSHSYWRSNGNSLVGLYDYEAHVGRLEELEAKNNLPATFFVEPPKSDSEFVWDDVNAMLCLNADQARRKIEAHVCPLPFDIVDRLIERYTSDPDITGEAEIVLDPFAGLFTVAYRAILKGRRGIGLELGSEYFTSGVRYCRQAQAKKRAPTLFDLSRMLISEPA